MMPAPCHQLNGRLRVVLNARDTNPDAIMGYAHTVGAVTMEGSRPVYHLRGRYNEIADIGEDTLRAYLDPAGTCARNNAAQN